MSEAKKITGGRDFDANPYSVDEARVAAWLLQMMPEIGSGDDPSGFLLASYECLTATSRYVSKHAQTAATARTCLVRLGIQNPDGTLTPAYDHPPGRWRIPKSDDGFFIANAGRMFELLSGVDHHPPGCPINPALRQAIQDLFSAAYADGIDTIGVAECGLSE